MIHTFLWRLHCSLSSCASSPLPLSSLSLSLSLHNLFFHPTLSLCIAESSSFPTHSAPSVPVFQGRRWALVCSQTEIAGSLQNAAAAQPACACLCVNACERREHVWKHPRVCDSSFSFRGCLQAACARDADVSLQHGRESCLDCRRGDGAAAALDCDCLLWTLLPPPLTLLPPPFHLVSCLSLALGFD